MKVAKLKFFKISAVCKKYFTSTHNQQVFGNHNVLSVCRGEKKSCLQKGKDVKNWPDFPLRSYRLSRFSSFFLGCKPLFERNAFLFSVLLSPVVSPSPNVLFSTFQKKKCINRKKLNLWRSSFLKGVCECIFRSFLVIIFHSPNLFALDTFNKHLERWILIL